MPVKIEGINEVLASLDLINPTAAKELDRNVKAAAMPIVAKARGYAPATAPLSGWSHAVGKWTNKVYDGNEVRAGIGFANDLTPPNKKGFTYTAYVYNKSVAGAIFETAGRKHPNGQKPAKRVKGWTGGAHGAGEIGDVWQTGKNVNRSANPNAGKQFIDSMGAIYKVPRVKGQVGRSGRKQNGRLIYRAWGENQGRVLGSIAKTYSDIVQRFNEGRL